MEFDASRAHLHAPDKFRRFRVPRTWTSLTELGLRPDEQLLVFERAGHRAGLLRTQMIYHHVAQGNLGGEPFLISF